ncbi:MAG: septal ring lytic transglycosylase RlpA family protein [Spirochaetia bacterium]|jgi:rare lipoprotein A|nr:septal ring lytic transglycosylase RlpA family protein [Spirochaetia bacterium]
MKGKTLKTAFLAAFLSAAFLAFADGEEGFASWYGGKFHGRKTANGEIFDTNKLTAAHKTLGFGTKVRVTESESGKSVIVRINDRGPFVENRIIDLSKAAADIIGLTARGVAKVKLEIVEAQNPASPFITLQVASFGSQDNALRLKNKLFEAGLSPSIETTEAGIHRVLLEHVPLETVDSVKSRLAALGLADVVVRR